MSAHHHHHHPTPPAVGDKDQRYRDIRRVTLVGSAVDLSLGLLKLLFGYLAHSQALVADGVHSLSDLATDVMVIFAAKHGSRDADECHPYGHGRIETMATVALGAVLVIVAAGIAWDASSRLFHPDELLQPGKWALAIAVISVISKEWTYHYTMRLARRLKSEMLRANAWHSRTDAISSVVVVVGLLGTMAGLPYLDAIAAIAVALMVAKIGWDLAWPSVHELVDRALDADRVEEIRRVILSVDGVMDVHMLRTRRMGGEALVDVHILVPPRLSVSEGHFISETVRHRLIKEIDEVQDVLVHIDPEDDEEVAPSQGQPSRSQIRSQLEKAWHHIEAAAHIERMTLHYINGKLIVEAVLPLSVASSMEIADRLRQEMRAAAAGIPVIERLEVYFD
jgi:cation diffusion facilitator family transporter